MNPTPKKNMDALVVERDIFKKFHTVAVKKMP